jgi:hypothetical protein
MVVATTGGESAGPTNPGGMGWRVSLSIVATFGALIAAILWLFFYAGRFNVYQNIAVIVVIFLIFIAIMGAAWASWGMRQRDWWKPRS